MRVSVIKALSSEWRKMGCERGLAGLNGTVERVGERKDSPCDSQVRKDENYRKIKCEVKGVSRRQRTEEPITRLSSERYKRRLGVLRRPLWR
jgi:hypothetical protein